GPGAHVYVSHVVPVSLVVAGEEQEVRTPGRTVGDVLAQAGVSLHGEDYVSPGASTSVRRGLAVSVTTVRELPDIGGLALGYASRPPRRPLGPASGRRRAASERSTFTRRGTQRPPEAEAE